jgi:hypothetical protein
MMKRAMPLKIGRQPAQSTKNKIKNILWTQINAD